MNLRRLSNYLQDLPQRGAYRKGQEARLRGEPLSACPYTDKRETYKNSVTYSRSFVRAWREGWETGHEVQE
jgi:hypothetical protein